MYKDSSIALIKTLKSHQKPYLLFLRFWSAPIVYIRPFINRQMNMKISCIADFRRRIYRFFQNWFTQQDIKIQTIFRLRPQFEFDQKISHSIVEFGGIICFGAYVSSNYGPFWSIFFTKFNKVLPTKHNIAPYSSN